WCMGGLSPSGGSDGTLSGSGSSDAALRVSGGKRAYTSLLPSNQTHQTIGSPPAAPILVTVMSGPPDLSLTVSPTLNDNCVLRLPNSRRVAARTQRVKLWQPFGCDQN